VTPTSVELTSANASQAVPFIAGVTADAGVGELTYVWTTTDAAKATVAGNNGGATVTVLPAASGSVGVQLTVTAENGSQASGTAQINIAPSSISGVVVTPPQLVLSTTDGPVTATASVDGTGAYNPHVTWSVGSQGVITIGGTSSTHNEVAVTVVAPGTTVIRATADGDQNKSASIQVTVTAPLPATISIQSVTALNQSGNEVPVQLTNASGQFQVHLNIDRGEQTLERIDAVIAGQVVASQSFGVAAVAASPEAASDMVVLSVNSAQVRTASNAFIPVVYNGNAVLRADLYVAGSATPVASNAVPLVLNNADAIVLDAPVLRPTSTLPFAVGLNGGTYFRGTQTVAGFQYIAFGRTVPREVKIRSTLCGSTGNLIQSTASATTGIELTGTYDCANLEGPNRVATPVDIFFQAGSTGPDGTPLTRPTQLSSIGAPFVLAGESRWHMITPAGGNLPGPVHVDNKPPTVSLGKVAFREYFDESWINASYAFTSDLEASDSGSGLAQGSPQARLYAPGTFDPVTDGCTSQLVTTGADLIETETSASIDGKRICTWAEDRLGNSAQLGPSNYFGVDKTPPTIRLITSTLPGPAGTPTSVNNTIYSIMNPPVPGQVFGVETIDERSGFHQSPAIDSFPVQLSLRRVSGAGKLSCTLSTFSPTPTGFSALLSDNFVRSMEVPIACGTPGDVGGVGYFFFSGRTTDRAGNVGGPVERVYLTDHLAPPSLATIAPMTEPYTPGEDAPFRVFAFDDVEIAEVDLLLAYSGLAGPFSRLSYLRLVVPGATRFDTVAVSTLPGTPIPVPSFLGRVDFTCAQLGLPYPTCTLPDSLPKFSTDFNNVDTDLDGVAEDDDKNPIQVSGMVYDVAGQASPLLNFGLLSALSGDVAQQWSNADIIFWRIRTPTSSTLQAEQKSSTSSGVAAFSSVLLGRVDAGGTQLVVCSISSASPTRTDNGLNRFWTWNLAKPVSGPCATVATGLWFVIGIKNGAGLATQGVP
jgi:hypothetical protein